MIKVTFLCTWVIFLSLCYSAKLQEIISTTQGCPIEYPCRELGILGFPFFSGTNAKCGLIEVDCYNKKIKLGNESQWYDVSFINRQRSYSRNDLEIRDTLLQERLESRNCDSFKNFTLPSTPFINYYLDTSLTSVIICTQISNATAEYFGGYYNYTGCSGYSLYYTYPYDKDGSFTAVAALPPTCSIIWVPVERLGRKRYSDYSQDEKTRTYSDPFQFITANLKLNLYVSVECFVCQEFGGMCSTNSHQKFQCIGGNRLQQPKQGGAGMLAKILKGTLGSAIVVLIVVVFTLRRKIFMMWRKVVIMLKKIATIIWRKIAMMWRKVALTWTKKKNRKHNGAMRFNSTAKWYRYSDIKNFIMKRRKKTKSHHTVKNFLKNYGSIGPKRYRYSEIKKMTNSFQDKLGEGGYGSVYKGKLRNGNLVAVKVIKESKGDGEEFFNEVASISRTSHVNIVTLLGFCIEGRKRALLYEFMPNGSLEKFLENGVSSTKSKLGAEESYRIAIGIARGLEYLHRGCNTRILHFDIKPHNILLDEDFVPKISDFGLSKLCPPKESDVSMMNARGTIGYIAPEVFYHNNGRVSHKSDVYSYGMMVLEMVGCRKNTEVKLGYSSELYFPDWIYKKLESDKEVGTREILNEEDNLYVKMMVIVSLWCIQTNPLTRPSMSRVVEMLEGSLESLEIPPKPVLSSPSLTQTVSSTIDTS